MIIGLIFSDEDDVCDYYGEDYDFEQCKSLELQNQCKTVDGTPCVFPFMFRGKSVTNCVTGQRRKKPWCPTEVDSNGRPVPDQWGNCNDECPTEGSDFGRLSLYVKGKI